MIIFRFSSLLKGSGKVLKKKKGNPQFNKLKKGKWVELLLRFCQ